MLPGRFLGRCLLPAARAVPGVNALRHVYVPPGGPLNGLACPVPTQRRWSSPTPQGCWQRYQHLRSSGELREDARQEICMKKLDDLAKSLTSYAPKLTKQSVKAAAPASSGGWMSGLFGGKAKAAKVAKPPTDVAPKPAPGQRGLYLWGGTGTGKTFMMDLFFKQVQVKEKQRLHFHEWMIDVHQRLHVKQQALANKGKSADDLVEQVALDMVKKGWLLCFDEFQVTHISDAIIMKRIFSVLFELGAVVVATSNRPPEDLYLNGLNRTLFVPFIPILQDFCTVHDIGQEVDYRMLSTAEEQGVYFTPNDGKQRRLLSTKFEKLCHGRVRDDAVVQTQGRTVKVPRCGKEVDVAWFSFQDLCDQPLGAADYLEIGRKFHTIFIVDIPLLTMQERDQVRRCITLMDALYESHTQVICSAAAEPMKLFHVSPEERKTSTADEIFAWDRTVSRLTEMQSSGYLNAAARSLSSEQFLGQYKLTSLTDRDCQEIWRRYDSDDSNSLDLGELRLLLEDLLEKLCGHRELSNELFETCRTAMATRAADHISFEEFQSYLCDYSRMEAQLRSA